MPARTSSALARLHSDRPLPFAEAISLASMSQHSMQGRRECSCAVQCGGRIGSENSKLSGLSGRFPVCTVAEQQVSRVMIMHRPWHASTSRCCERGPINRFLMDQHRPCMHVLLVCKYRGQGRAL
jgi:hypothetical protein